MRRILLMVTVALVMVAMMIVMAGTASAQPTVIGACINPSGRVVTLIAVTIPSGEDLHCIGKPRF